MYVVNHYRKAGNAVESRLNSPRLQNPLQVNSRRTMRSPLGCWREDVRIPEWEEKEKRFPVKWMHRAVNGICNDFPFPCS